MVRGTLTVVCFAAAGGSSRSSLGLQTLPPLKAAPPPAAGLQPSMAFNPAAHGPGPLAPGAQPRPPPPQPAAAQRAVRREWLRCVCVDGETWLDPLDQPWAPSLADPVLDADRVVHFATVTVSALWTVIYWLRLAANTVDATTGFRQMTPRMLHDWVPTEPQRRGTPYAEWSLTAVQRLPIGHISSVIHAANMLQVTPLAHDCTLAIIRSLNDLGGCDGGNVDRHWRRVQGD